MRTIPPLAWLPIALAALKDNGLAAIFVIFITAVWPILINTTVGVQQIPQDYINVKRVLKLSNKAYFFKILLPASLPYIAILIEFLRKMVPIDLGEIKF